MERPRPTVTENRLDEVFGLAKSLRLAYDNDKCPNFRVSYRMFIGDSVVCTNSTKSGLKKFFAFVEEQGIDSINLKSNLWASNHDVKLAKERKNLDWRFSTEQHDTNIYTQFLPFFDK